MRRLDFTKRNRRPRGTLCGRLSLQSYSGGFRVFILGDIDFASAAAANALLKFFEEPPSHVLLLLTTSTPARLLSTIRSRLVEVRFPTLRHAQVVEILRAKNVDSESSRAGRVALTRVGHACACEFGAGRRAAARAGRGVVFYGRPGSYPARFMGDSRDVGRRIGDPEDARSRLGGTR